MVNTPFANFWCVTIFAADLVCWLAGHSAEMSCRGYECTPQKGSFASHILAASLFRSWSVVTNNAGFNSPGAEGVQNTILTSPWICSGAGLAGLAGKTPAWEVNSLLNSCLICRHTTEHTEGASLQQHLSCQQQMCKAWHDSSNFKKKSKNKSLSMAAVRCGGCVMATWLCPAGLGHYEVQSWFSVIKLSLFWVTPMVVGKLFLFFNF